MQGKGDIKDEQNTKRHFGLNMQKIECHGTRMTTQSYFFVSRGTIQYAIKFH